MSGSVQKTIPEERILRIEREIHARKNRRRFLKNLRRLKKPGVKQPVAVAVVGQLPEAAESAAAELRLAHQNRHKFFACNRFMLVQVFSDFMKLGQVILQKLDRFLVLCFYKIDGQGISPGLCLG